MAISAARFYGADLGKIREALATFKGIARRRRSAAKSGG